MKNSMKKLVTLCLAMAMVATSVVTSQKAEVKAADEIVNYALDAVVTTSSNESADLNGSKATDGDMSTRWSSQFTNGQWIQLDFGKIVKIGSVQIFWEAAYAAEYTLSWSNDGETWNDAVSWGCHSYEEETSHMFYSRPVRYIRLTCNKRGTAYGVSLFEIRALGYANQETQAPTQATTQAPTTTVASNAVNLATDATVSASSIEAPEYAASNILDGDKNTRWSSAFKDGESVVMDLGSVCNLESVKIYWEAAFAKEFQVEWSLDGTKWTNASKQRISKFKEDTVVKFYNREVRYIRITCIERGTPYGVSILDVDVMGTKQDNVTTEATTEATTVAPTTTEEATTEATTDAPTTEEATTVAPTEVQTTVEETTKYVEPLEVMGVVVGTPRDNMVSVVWGQDADRINSGCRYNVYINGVKKLDNGICNYYEFDGLAEGQVEVLIRSVLNGCESTGKRYYVNVTGKKVSTNVALGAKVEGPSMEGCEASNLTCGDLTKVWRVQQLYPIITIDLGRVVNISSAVIKWMGDYDAPKGVTVFTSADGENWSNGINVDIMNFDYYTYATTISVNQEARYVEFCMGRYSNLPHFYGAREIEIYD